MTTIRLKWPLLIVAAMILAAIFLGGRISPTDEPAPTPTPAITTPPARTSTTTTGRDEPDHTEEEHQGHQHAPGEGVQGEEPEPVETPDYHGGHGDDFAHSNQEQAAALEATTEFVTAWLTPEADCRAQLLEPVAAEALVEALADPQTRIWNTSTEGSPTIHAASGQAVTTGQAMADGRAVELLLHYEPDAKHGWIVTGVAPTRKFNG